VTASHKKTNISIVPAESDDFEAIARLHVKSIPAGFLSKLGYPFLVEIYKAIGKESDSVVYVARSGVEVVGFVVGATDIRRVYTKVIAGNWYRFIFPLLRFIFKPGSFRRIVETTLYGFKKKNHDGTKTVLAELLSIAIDESTRGKGIGRALLTELEQFFKNYGISEYKVVTFSHDDPANCFYRSCKFSVNRKFVHHGHVMNEYVKTIV